MMAGFLDLVDFFKNLDNVFLMETIIRTIFSNTNYDYFNILTHHSFVNPYSNEAISTVMDFTSMEN